MRSIKDFFGIKDGRTSDTETLRAEARQFKTPGEWLPSILKYAFFFGLAFLNFRLFHKTVGGAYGVAIGCLAVMGEIFAIYAIHNFSRSSGWYQATLGIGGAALSLFAITHSAFSFFDIVGDVPFAATVHTYAKIYAFPILFSLIGLMAIACKMTHPKNEIRREQAKAHSDILIDRARAASELELTLSRGTIDRAHLARVREKNALDTELLGELRNTIDNQSALRDMLADVPDPELRKQLAKDFGVQLPDPNQPQGQTGQQSNVRQWRGGQVVGGGQNPNP